MQILLTIIIGEKIFSYQKDIEYEEIFFFFIAWNEITESKMREHRSRFRVQRWRFFIIMSQH